MFNFLLKILPGLISWGIFIFVIIDVPYPNSITSANIIQISSFFLPLFLALIFSLNIFFKKILLSSLISLGLVCVLILKALDSLNLVTVILTTVSIYLLVSYFRKSKKSAKIPNLWRKL